MRQDSENPPDQIAHIAIVEDDVNNRKEWIKALEQWPGYRVIGEFGSGRKPWKCCRGIRRISC